MPDGWLQRKLRKNSKIEKKTAELTDAGWLSTREAAARCGVTVGTLERWIFRKVIPKPRKYGNGSVSKRPFRRKYVELLRNFIIIRNSSVGYSTLKSFKKLTWKKLFGVR